MVIPESSKWLVVQSLKKSIEAIEHNDASSDDWRQRRLVCVARAALKTFEPGTQELSEVAELLYAKAESRGFVEVLESFARLNLPRAA